MELESILGAWSAGRGPLHRKLSDALRVAVDDGLLLPGTRLPSERDLARRLAVSRSTVVAAYDDLRTGGVLESRRGSGTRVGSAAPGRLAPRITPHLANPVYRALLAEPTDLVSLAAACHATAHPLVAEAIAAVVAEDLSGLLAMPGYLPRGLPAFRAAVADLLTDGGLPTEPPQVLVTTGAQQAIALCAGLLVGPGATVVVENPNFPGTLDSFRGTGVHFASVPVDDDGVDADAVVDVVERLSPAAVYLMPSFHNPTGAALSAHRRQRIADLAANTGVPIVEDNALEYILLGDPPPPPVATFAAADAPILTVGSLSKLAWGGLRVGWVRGPVPLIDRLGHLKVKADLGTPVLDQAVAARLLPAIDQLRDDARVEAQAMLARTGDLLGRLLPDWRWRPPRGGPSLWIRLPQGTASGFAQVALRYGVEIIPGETMSPTGDHRDHFRFPFTSYPDRLEVVVQRLADAWAAYAGGSLARDSGASVVV